MEIKTRRPDLEAQAVSLPPYLVDKVLPYLPKMQEAGRLYYQTWKEDVAAQSGRDTAGLSSITAHTIAAADKTFSCSEVYARIRMSYDQIRGYGSKELADLAMGRMAKRSFYNQLETSCASALLDVVTPIDGVTDPVAALDTATVALRDKGIGRIALVTSNFNFVRLKNDPTVKARMIATGVATYGLEPRYITAEQMAAILGVDEVLIGRDDLWHSGINAEDRGNVALVILPNENEDPAEAVQLGRTIFFAWDSVAEHFIMESWEDPFVDANVVDAKGLVDMQILNAALMSTVQIFSAAASSSASL